MKSRNVKCKPTKPSDKTHAMIRVRRETWEKIKGMAAVEGRTIEGQIRTIIASYRSGK